MTSESAMATNSSSGQSSSYLLEFRDQQGFINENSSSHEFNDSNSRRGSIDKSFGHGELDTVGQMISQNRSNGDMIPKNPKHHAVDVESSDTGSSYKQYV